ncbi:hypothetical protein RhiXN_10785 [Rhizoctonia solani]|uniref:Uncharacterized protein n=1 Tax=Rhizoctonia solani TaxID=456999 RepID=A0A8H8T1D6_9AGAM|nr:uncharacterized protein RhiXN_10785 [Rhizoctonia solani]QRW25709.1 hypothetical protein RhiXN_10785 [Rhizoctonia solani]
MDFNSWMRQQEEAVARTWHALKREEDEIEREEAVVVALGQRLSRARDTIQLSPRHRIDELMYSVAKDEARMLASIDAVGARLAHEKSVFQREIARITHSRANTPRTDRHTRQAWDYAERIWRAEEASIQERIDRVATMGIDCRRRLAASSTYSPPRRRPSTTTEPTPDERPRERTKSSASHFVRERRTSTGAVLVQPPAAVPVPAYSRERRPSQAIPVAPGPRPATSAARPSTAGASRHYPAVEDSPRDRERERESKRGRAKPEKPEREERDRERERERDRDRDHEREHRREHRERRERTRSTAAPPPTTHPTRPRICPPPEHPSLRLPTCPPTRRSITLTPTPPTLRPKTECASPLPGQPTSAVGPASRPLFPRPPPHPSRSTMSHGQSASNPILHDPSPRTESKKCLSLWRPEQWEDKWINNVEPSERDKVRYGVSIVAQCIGELLKEASRKE